MFLFLIKDHNSYHKQRYFDKATIYLNILSSDSIQYFGIIKLFRKKFKQKYFKDF